MKTLFIDTSSSSLAVALIDSGIVNKREIDSVNEHSKYALSELDLLFKNSNIKPVDIEQIMVINGPGSFTGVRIGVTIAKTFGWSLNKKVIPISTLKAYAISNSNYDYYVCVIDARRNYVYGAIYDKDYNDVLEEKYISIEEINNKINDLKGNILIIGDIAINDNDYIKPILNIDSIYNYYKDMDGINAHILVPNYLKMVEAEENYESKNIREYKELDKNLINILGRDLNSTFLFKLSNVGKCLVYDKDNTILGFIIFDIYDDRAEIIDIIVNINNRKQSIGSNLLSSAISIIKKNGCKSITLEVKVNNEAAIALYKKYEFKIVSTRKKYYENNTLDAHLMYREL